MSRLREGIESLKQSVADGTPMPSPTRSWSDGTDIVVDSGTGSVNVHKHSNGDEFLAVPIVAIVFTFIWLIVKAIMAPFHHKNRATGQATPTGGLSAEEVAILQKLQRTLSQMESRIEALETILIDQNRPTAQNYGSKL